MHRQLMFAILFAIMFLIEAAACATDISSKHITWWTPVFGFAAIMFWRWAVQAWAKYKTVDN